MFSTFCVPTLRSLFSCSHSSVGGSVSISSSVEYTNRFAHANLRNLANQRELKPGPVGGFPISRDGFTLVWHFVSG